MCSGDVLKYFETIIIACNKNLQYLLYNISCNGNKYKRVWDYDLYM